jgi:hypothetical protein
VKLGKREATPDNRDLRFAAYLVELPKVPARFGHGLIYRDWGMLGNDNYGDCVWAGAAHETMLWNKLVHRRQIPFTDTAVLSDYAAVTGFNPEDSSTDQGTYVRDAMRYRQDTGVVDAKGARHKISVYVSLDPKNWDDLRAATYLFGAVGIGFEFPASAMSQFNRGHTWDVVEGSMIEGGHYVPVVGSMTQHMATCVTWGHRQEMTREFYEAFNDEAWAFISPEAIKAGHGLHGFDLDTLKKDLQALRA